MVGVNPDASIESNPNTPPETSTMRQPPVGPVRNSPVNSSVNSPIDNNVNASMAEIIATAVTAALTAQQSQQPKPRRQDYDKPPTYNVQELDENAIGAQIQDWISGISRGNEERLHCPVRSQVNWACSKLSPPLQTQFRIYEEQLKSDGKETSMQALYDFVGKTHLDPDYQTNKHRDELRELSQADRSPEDYYARFADLSRLIGRKNFRTDPNFVSDYRHGLHDNLKFELAKQQIPNTDAWDIAKRAQHIWEVLEERKRWHHKRRVDNYMPIDRPFKRTKNDHPNTPEFYPPMNNFSYDPWL